MGIFIYMSISQSVTKSEWEAVYNETLRLVEAFPLAEIKDVNIREIKTRCLVRTKERQQTYGWNDEEVRTGWFADGDYETLHVAEEYHLLKDLVTEQEYCPDAPDAILGILPAYMNYKWDDPQFNHFYDIWNGKTQGEPYHMCLLAIACLIESRLGEKACVYGDITRGQCRKAVEMANKYLDKIIDLPVRCDPDRFLERIKRLPLSQEEMLEVYTHLYLGAKDGAFGNTARKNFSDEIFEAYWRKKFDSYAITTRGFADALYDYLLWGFDLEKLAQYVSFTDKDGNEYYENFVKQIMDAKLYVQEKDCSDVLKIDPEDERPYGISTLFAQIAYGSAINRKVDRYVPIDDIRRALVSSIGDKCDVNKLIDEYLKEDEEFSKLESNGFDTTSEEEMKIALSHDASTVFSHAMEYKRKEREKLREKYDIPEFAYLPFFETGDSMDPAIKEQVGKYFTFYRGVTKEKRFEELMNEDPASRCRWLARQNQYVLLRDVDWDKIYADIFDNPESFARYYPMVRVQISGDSLPYLIRAIATNDAFYRYAFELENEYIEKEDASCKTSEEPGGAE